MTPGPKARAAAKSVSPAGEGETKCGAGSVGAQRVSPVSPVSPEKTTAEKKPAGRVADGWRRGRSDGMKPPLARRRTGEVCIARGKVLSLMRSGGEWLAVVVALRTSGDLPVLSHIVPVADLKGSARRKADRWVRWLA